MIFRAWCLLAMSLCSAALFSSQLKSIAVKQPGNQTSIYLTVNGPFTHKIFALSQPDRIVLDLKETQLMVNLKQLGLSNDLIKQVRSGYSESKTLRLVFEVRQKVQLRSLPWRPSGAYGGIKIDLVHSAKRVVPVVANASGKLIAPVSRWPM